MLANSGAMSERHRDACNLLSLESVPRILQDIAKPHNNHVKSMFLFSFYIKNQDKKISYLVQLVRGRAGMGPGGPAPLQVWTTPKIKMLSCCKWLKYSHPDQTKRTQSPCPFHWYSLCL